MTSVYIKTCDVCGQTVESATLSAFDAISLRGPLAWFKGKDTCSEMCFWLLADEWYESRPSRSMESISDA